MALQSRNTLMMEILQLTSRWSSFSSIDAVHASASQTFDVDLQKM
jgi:hypothetical protein